MKSGFFFLFSELPAGSVDVTFKLAAVDKVGKYVLVKRRHGTGIETELLLVNFQ